MALGELEDGGDFSERQSPLFKGFPLNLEMWEFDSTHSTLSEGPVRGKENRFGD